MAKSKDPQSVYSHQKLETANLRVPFRQLATETEKYQYRDLTELNKKDEAYKQLKAKISDVGGNDVAILVKPDGPIEWDGTTCSIPEGTKLVIIDGHRRHSVIGDLISEGVKPFHPEMLVKVDVIVSDGIKDEELVIRAASLNTTQKTWGEFGRIKAATSLYTKHGITNHAVLASALGVSESTVKRDLGIGQRKKLFDFLKDGYIKYAQLSNIIEGADKGKVPTTALEAEFEKLIGLHKAKYVVACAEGKAKGKPVTKTEAQWVSDVMGKLAKSWKDDLQAGKVEYKESTTIPFRCEIIEENGVQKLDIGSFSKPLSALSADLLGDIIASLHATMEELQPIAAEKQEREATTPGGKKMTKAERLKKLGLGKIAAKKEAQAEAADVAKGVKETPPQASPDTLTPVEEEVIEDDEEELKEEENDDAN